MDVMDVVKLFSRDTYLNSQHPRLEGGGGANRRTTNQKQPTSKNLCLSVILYIDVNYCYSYANE